ncbi:hypothetical protein CEXT_33871 [Caerostris extrusa]|uniref:Uncharacterized protein n=1 Tax=Caerostris extrusa TaxID=172846 RepID=A0AAV4N0K3_CAEEX|nr:hypothetical protein CEXT_33871 [Caerostris extrusa]
MFHHHIFQPLEPANTFKISKNQQNKSNELSPKNIHPRRMGASPLIDPSLSPLKIFPFSPPGVQLTPPPSLKTDGFLPPSYLLQLCHMLDLLKLLSMPFFFHCLLIGYYPFFSLIFYPSRGFFIIRGMVLLQGIYTVTVNS